MKIVNNIICNSIKIISEDINKHTLYSHSYNNVEFKSGHAVNVGAYVFTQSVSSTLDFAEWIEYSEIMLK